MGKRVLPEALKLARRAAGLSQADLARKSGLSIGYIGMLETGKRACPRPPVLEALSKALEVSPDVLVREDGAGVGARAAKLTTTPPSPPTPAVSAG